MRILIDVRLLFSGVHTGVEEYTVNLISKMLEADGRHRYRFFANGWHTLRLPRPWRNVSSVNWGVPNRILNLSFRYLSFPKVDRFAPADIYFSPHLNLLKLSPAARHIMTVHDLSFVRFPHFFSRRQRWWHLAQNARREALRARQLIAVSEATKCDLVSLWNVPEDRVTVVHSGISSRYRPASPDDLALPRFRVAKNLAKPFLLYVGTVEPRKNLVGALEAFGTLKRNRAFRDLEFVIAGRLGWLYGEVVRAIRESPHRSAIRLWGPANPGDILLLYQSAAAFVYPSFFEGFGFPPLEAQACGCPVVASRGGSLPEVLGESAILVDPLRHEELADAIHRVLTDRGEAERLRARGLANVARFSWEKAARETLACFEAARKS